MFDGIEYRGAAQMLADILTMRDHASKPLAEVSYCYLGDGRNNVANSLLVTGALLGMDVRICAPWSLQPSERVQEIAGKLAAESGALLTVTADVLAAVAGADFLCLVSRTLVRRDDPAFAHPSTFVGPVYSEEQARALAASEHWEIRQDGARWRRVVPSPEPAGLPDLPAIRTLLGTGAIVVCARGGGVPVVVRDGQARGVEAVVDKDLTASLLARELDADALLLLTDVAAVQDGYGTPQARPIRRATPDELRKRDFPAGSMGPKIEAVCRFTEATGTPAAIGRLADTQALLVGRAGTLICSPGPRAAVRATLV